jgi:hypothetical protein
MNWDALGSIADAVSALVAVGALILAYLAYKKSPQLMERMGQSLEDQRKLAEAEAQANKEQGNRDVILEHRIDPYTVIRNRATIDRDGRILKLYAHKGPWKVGQKISQGEYREIDQSRT